MEKTNWGAGLSALGQGLEGIAARMYAERQQREQQARQDQMLAEQRAYAERMYTQRLNETDPLMPVPAPVANFVGLPEHQVGPMPNMNLPQYQRTSVVSKWNDMLPPEPRPERPADPRWILESGGQRTLGFGNPASFQSQGYEVIPGGMDPETGMAVYRMVPRPLDGAGAAGGGAGSGKQPDITKAAGGFTERALGPSYQRVSQDGVVTDYSYGGFLLPAPELGAMPPEYRRSFEQAAADSMASNPAYLEPGNQPALAQGIYSDLGVRPDVNLAPPFLPEGWSFNPGRGDFREDDPFPGNPFKGGAKMRAADFFREKLLPQVEPGGVTEIEYRKLLKLADEYNLDDAARRELGLKPKGGPADTEGF